MKKINKKDKKSIFTKLIVSYIIFAFVSVVTFFAGALLILIFAGGGDINNLVPSQLVSSDGSLADLSVVYEAEGWVEKLDNNYKVIHVYGDKRTQENKYTASQLLNMTRAATEREDYLFFYEPFEEGAYLFCYPRTSLTITFSYELDSLVSNSQEGIIIILFIAVVLLEGILIGTYIYRKIRMPLKEFIHGMQRMENGERSFQLNFRADGEFLVLRDAFNRMISHVNQAETDKERLQKDRQQMLLELSHDLKSPIAIINNCAFALKEGVVTETQRDTYYRMIADKTNRVSEMADDMFTMLKMESNEYNPKLDKLDFYEFVRQVCAEYYNELEQAGFEVEINIPEGQCYISGDERLLQRAVGNLFINVMKHSVSGKSVEIKVLKESQKAVLIIADDGEQISPNISSNMFLAFSRDEKSEKYKGGTGLGLAIVKAVIEKHRGQILYGYENRRNEFQIIIDCIEA